jgi:hypothetical protein
MLGAEGRERRGRTRVAACLASPQRLSLSSAAASLAGASVLSGSSSAARR